MKKIKLVDLGVIDYGKAFDYQHTIFEKVINEKIGKTTNSEEQIIFCEHTPVFTLGKSGKADNLLVNEAWLKMSGVEFYKTDRGGDITYHGPGQIVGYIIIDLEKYSIGIKEFISKIETAIIKTLSEYNIKAEILAGATGVWIDTKENARKICAIGVKASRYVTMHGFALNIATDLDYFSKIVPCGIPNKRVTSVENELNGKVSIEEIKMKLRQELAGVFNWEYY
ncbi:MAG: lipoyl(octanoyl) transferase LipB [Bacteroidales bacterium]|nr:lipoyl(octanoyl) transferase LipB [Bacteroidales bacterium]